MPQRNKNRICPPVVDVKLLALAIASFCLPLRHMRLTSDFGFRRHPLTGEWRFHAGVDLAANADTLFAIADGKVSRAGFNPTLGIFIRIIHGNGLESTYGHLSQVSVCAGDSVSVNEAIGLSGATGQVTGPHLHFAICYQHHYIDPLAFLFGQIQADEQLSNSLLIIKKHEQKNHESKDH